MATTAYKPTPYEFEALDGEASILCGREFFDLMNRRRSVRDFSTEAPPRECIELAIRTAASAPSGAHRQPWKFVIIDDPALKKAIREAAEEEEREVVVFKESYGVDDAGGKITNYYVNESVGIACGMFIAALHNMGLVTLTHTPCPMGFLSRLLNRPPNEKPYILFPVGYPAAGAKVPDLKRKSFAEVVQMNGGKKEVGGGRWEVGK